MKEVFCDGVSHVILSRGLVTIEFFHLVYQGENGPHKPVPFFAITLPIKGVLDLAGTGNKVLNHLVQSGYIYLVPHDAPADQKAVPAEETKPGKSKPAAAKKTAPAPAKKAEAKPAGKPAPAKKAAPAPAKKAEAKPAEKPAPAKKAAPAPAKKPSRGKKSAK